MSYIPKSAMRKINKVVKPLPKTEKGDTVTLIRGEPTVLRQGQPGAGMWDVYLDGVRQHLCQEAHAEKGYVIRYTHGSGSTPLSKQTERVDGCVVIVRKGQPMPEHLVRESSDAQT